MEYDAVHKLKRHMLTESHRRQFDGEDYQAVAQDICDHMTSPTEEDYLRLSSSPDPDCDCGFCESAKWSRERFSERRLKLMATETGWTDKPAVDGVYWWRMSANDPDPDICETDLEYGTVYDIGEPQGRTIAELGGEWLGPLSPSDAEQLSELRKLVRDYFTIDPVDDVAGWCEVSNKLMKMVGLNPSHAQKETQ